MAQSTKGLKNSSSLDPIIYSLAFHPKKIIKGVDKDLCPGVSIAALFMTVEELKVPSPLIGIAQEMITHYRMGFVFSIKNYAFEKYSMA